MRGTTAVMRVLALWIGLVLMGCQPGKDASGDVPTHTVGEPEKFVRRVTADGYLKAVEATPVTAPQDSERPLKIAWLVPDGTRVKKGEAIVRFDFSEMEKQLRDSEDDVRSAERQVKKEKIDARVVDEKHGRTAELADREVDVAREFALEDDDILSRNEIIETRIDIDIASAKAEHAREVKRIEGSVAKSKIALHEISKRQANNEVERAKTGLANLEVQAPHDGILVLRRDWRGRTLQVGDTVWRGQKLAELPLVAVMEAELFALEADAGDLAVDQRAEVVIEAHPEQIHPGKVKRVDALAKPRHQEVPVQYFGVTVELEKTDPATMKVGQRVRATIIIELDDAIVVPRQAVFDDDGQHVVHRKSATGFEKVPVELGPSSAGRVVITEGLSAGDEIALRDPTRAVDQLLDAENEEKSDKAGGPGSPGGAP